MELVGNENKTERILTIYRMLTNGEVVNKQKAADRFGVNVRSIQRDIEDIRAHLANAPENAGRNISIVYDRKRKGFRMKGGVRKMTGGEFLAVCKVLLESRAFIKEELDSLLEKLLDNCAPPSERKSAAELILNERFHYIEPHHHTPVVDKLWELGSAMRSHQNVKLWYEKLKADQPVMRIVKPVGIMFSEYYFYLIAFIEKGEEEAEYLSPAIYRIDRIHSFHVLDSHFSVPYKDRFEEGEFRKRVQFMFGGRLQRIVFEYSGLSIEAVLDRLPTAEVVDEQDSADGKKKIYTIRAEVFGDGIDMWLRAQGENVRMLRRKYID